MKIQLALLTAALVAVLLNACSDGSDESPSPIQIDIDFNSPTTDSIGGFSDYTPGTEPGNVVVEPRSLPQPHNGFGLYTFGTNRSDDLFIYIKRKFTGFTPNVRYSLVFSVQFLTDAPAGCVGVGGAPGEAVTVKGGASPVEPLTVLVNGQFQMNIDKGNQANSGKDALALGNIANSNTNCNDRRYESKTLASSSPLQTTSDGAGSIWFLFGIDSGFESASNIYYQSVRVTASPIAS